MLSVEDGTGLEVADSYVSRSELEQFLAGAGGDHSSAGGVDERTLEERLDRVEEVHHVVQLSVSLEEILKLPKQVISFAVRYRTI